MRKKVSVLLSIFVVITIIAMGMFLIFKEDLFVFRNNKPVYTKGEPVLVELKYEFTEEELIKKIGKPKKVKKEWWGAYGDYVEYCYYDWGSIWLAPGVKKNSFYIIYAEINKRGIKGPRGIEVGDSYKRVINKFRYSPEKIGGEEYLYYIKPKTKDDTTRFGCIIYNEKGEIDSIYYQDSLYYKIEFKISKGRVKQIVAYYHDT
ncbi:hypothetical protein ELD05_02090 [Caldicellulosiruptor changbaiensis]|uniref:Uncharacterized protein n=1 Tax=Caldicellulosiruptor changbaiensis TaxID=1222016 RepID=A0A3T0D2S9_9FIRM|nr:hypothetical protein [Caldicellulosiruptor changbaiensis]AZT89557.1 hypothetical protein ELD05_02090 [Caldicellulosiruptor changbaiensis]